MSRIAPLPFESTPHSTRPLLQEAVNLAGGRLLNLHAAMAHSHAVLASYIGVRKAIGEHSALDHKTGAAIMLAVSGVDDADYSLAVATRVAYRAGWSVADTEALHSGASSDSKLAALLAVARQAAANTGHVEDATWNAAHAAGWSDDELVEAFAYIGLSLYVDYFNHYVGTELDVAAAPPIRSVA
jgi:hypothetical protein